MLRLFRAGLLLLLIHPFATCSGKSSSQIRSLALSPDGKVIAVDFGRDGTSFIYLIAVETGRATRLTDAKTGQESMPSFSPDGKRIAFSHSPGNGAPSRILVGNVDGSDLHPLSAAQANDFRPVFSDNKTIIFARSGYYGSYSPIAQPSHHDWNFYAADSDGANLRQLTRDHFYMVSDISVSPDGRNMVFVSSQEHGDAIEVRAIDDPAKPVQELRPHVPREPSVGQAFNCPSYLPDGKSIIFMAASNGKLPWSGYDYDIYRLDIGTGAVERLTEGNGYATDLRVSADGKTAVFLKWRSDWHATPNRNQLYRFDPQSHQVTPFQVNGLIEAGD